MNENKNVAIFSQKLAGWLMQRGFVLVGMEKSKISGAGRNVFFFKNSPEINAQIECYKAQLMNK